MSQLYAIDRERWSNMSIFDQMGNIYSEVGRSFNAKRRGNESEANGAALRAIDLFDATADTLVKQQSPKAREVLRAKESYLAAVYGTAAPEDMDSLDRYFMQFAVAARLTR